MTHNERTSDTEAASAREATARDEQVSVWELQTTVMPNGAVYVRAQDVVPWLEDHGVDAPDVREWEAMIRQEQASYRERADA